ncbi:hypothetical protein [Oligoflexus tunisiensis]|uniref:hypothetical protein n=1 Tax=Oligoflexus tunisiensis TaxID=708132 RepID=UPI001C40259D|nr:hypothetical protein [Oligoflexus tunisiensis]
MDKEIVYVPGQTAATMSASLLRPDSTSLALDVTEKGCVLIPKVDESGSEILFKSKVEAKRLAEIMLLTEVLQRKVIILHDMATYNVNMGCNTGPASINTIVHTRDHFNVWAEVTSETEDNLPASRHFNFATVFPSSEGQVSWQGRAEVVSTGNLAEGQHEFQLVARLKAFPEIAFTKDCSVIKDTTAPIVQPINKSRYYKDINPAILQLLPAEILELDTTDGNLVTLSTCWRSQAMPNCNLEPAGKQTVSAPTNGSWILHIHAEDQAGNTSDTQWPVIIYEKDRVTTLGQSALSAQLLAESNRWLEGLKLIVRTASEWASMPNTDHLHEVESQLRAAFIRLFFDQKPVLIQFEHKQNLEYLGNHKFFYSSVEKYLDKEVLIFEIHDFSKKPALHIKHVIERSPLLGEVVVLSAMENKKFILVRTSINTWKLFDTNLTEVRTFEVPDAKKDDSLVYFPAYDQAILETHRQYYLLTEDGSRISTDFSRYESSKIRTYPNDRILFSLDENLVWNPKGQVIFDGKLHRQQLRVLPTIEQFSKEIHLASFSCDDRKVCEFQLVNKDPDIPQLSKPIKVPYGARYHTSISRDGQKLLFSLDQNTLGLCSFQSGECHQRTFPAKVIATCLDPARSEFVILTSEATYVGQSPEVAQESQLYSTYLHNVAGQCRSTELGIVLKNFNETITIYSGDTRTFPGSVDFTSDGIYAMEAGLNSSEVRIISTMHPPYETQGAHSPSMIPEQHYFYQNGRIMVSIGDSFNIYDLATGISWDHLEKSIQSAGIPMKMLTSRREDELVVQYVDKISTFDTKDGSEIVLFQAPDTIMNSMDYRDLYLIQSKSHFTLIDHDGHPQFLSQFKLPDNLGDPICTAFDSSLSQFFLLYEQETLLSIDVRTGRIGRARLESHAQYPDPIQITSCIMHWNESDASLYIANDMSYLWRWKSVDDSEAEFIVGDIGIELRALNATPSGKVVMISSDMTYDKILVFDPKTGHIKRTGLGIDIRGGWVDNQTKTVYLAGFNGEIIALNPDLEDMASIVWKTSTGQNLSGIIVSEHEQSLVIKSFDGKMMSLDLGIPSLLNRACEWLQEANEATDFNRFCN